MAWRNGGDLPDVRLTALRQPVTTRRAVYRSVPEGPYPSPRNIFNRDHSPRRVWKASFHTIECRSIAFWFSPAPRIADLKPVGSMRHAKACFMRTSLTTEQAVTSGSGSFSSCTSILRHLSRPRDCEESVRIAISAGKGALSILFNILIYLASIASKCEQRHCRCDPRGWH